MKAPLLLSFLALACSAQAELRLAPLFCDHAVLQQGQPIPVWGWAAPREKVSVSFHGRSTETMADEHGNWRTALPAEKASSEPAELVVKGGETITLRDIVVGEVWLCSGQSNMEWRVLQAENAAQEVAGADFPQIRQFRLPKFPAETPLAEVKSTWIAASPKTAGTFSAVAFFFARDLQRDLKVPIGLINSSWGGKMIETFMSAEAIASDPSFATIEKRWQQEQARLPAMIAAYEKKAAAARVKIGAGAEAEAVDEEGSPKGMSPQQIVEQHRPSCVFNGLVAPVIPYAIRGAIWYQGEHNISRPGEYRALFSALIADWRKKFGQGDFPFYFAQLSAFNAPLDKTHEGYAGLREAQRQTLSVPNTGMAVTFDIGMPETVHPRNKQDVGARLARLAKAQTYRLGGEWSGPVLKSVVQEKNTLRVSFDHLAGGLVLKETPVPAFEVAGGDGAFHPALARVEGSSLILQSDAVPAPASVRYAWGNAPPAALFNSEGLPASPFRFPAPH